MNLEFERWIRQSPGQWVCMKRRWPRSPSRP
jgi:KDO2-lipid IV(A) lauroyltransferase